MGVAVKVVERGVIAALLAGVAVGALAAVLIERGINAC